MKILESDLATFVTAVILDVKRGCFDAMKNGDVVLRLPDLITFNCEVVKGSTYNTITRETTQSPATTQSDNSQQGGQDSTVTNTSYTQFTYVTSS